MRMTASWFRSARIDRIQGCGAISAPDGELPSELSSFAHCRKARPINVACRRARDRHCARRPIKLRSGRGDGRQVGRTRRGKRLKISLTVIAPYKGFGCRPIVAVRVAPRAGIRKPPGEEPAGAGQGVWGLWGFEGSRRPRGTGSMAARDGLAGRAIATGVGKPAASRVHVGQCGEIDGPGQILDRMGM
jgi:hypothetical protein